MLTAKKKLSVREAVPKSTSSSFYYDAMDWAKANTKLLAGVGIGIVAIVILGYFYMSGKAADELEANRQLRKVMPLYQQQQYKLAINGDANQGIPGLASIADKYSGTPTGEVAMIYLANAYLYTDELDKALAAYEDASPESDVLRSAAVAGEAAVYEAKKNYSEAAELYEKAASMLNNDLLMSQRQLAAGRAYGLAGNKEKAKEMLELVKQSKATQFHQMADRLLSQYELVEE